MILSDWRPTIILLVMAFLCLLEALPQTGGSPIGVVYESSHDSLYSASKAVQLLRRQRVTKVRLLDADAVVLKAFANTGIDVIVGLLNEEVMEIGESRFAALRWVQSSVLIHSPATRIRAVAVGNEFITIDSNLSAYLVPACQNVYAALQHFALDALIKVSAPQSFLLLESRFPPSSGGFSQSYMSSVLQRFLNFLQESGSFFMLNVHPVPFYKSIMDELSINFALLEADRGFDDPKSGLHYSNAFDALLDALFTAMASLGYGDVPVVVSATGWRLEGDQVDGVNSVQDAVTYANNLKLHLLSGVGTPLKLGTEIPTYFKDPADENGLLAPSHVQGGVVMHTRTLSVRTNATESVQISISSSFDKSWCIAKDYATPDSLQAALDWACGFGGADCQPIQLGNACFVPNTVYSHASYAFNSYYQIHQHASGTCDFAGVATVTYEDPSYPGCSYPFRAGQVGATAGGASLGIVQFYHAFIVVSVLLLMRLV